MLLKETPRAYPGLLLLSVLIPVLLRAAGPPGRPQTGLRILSPRMAITSVTGQTIPCARPDGSDDPEGQKKNRRVVIRIKN